MLVKAIKTRKFLPPKDNLDDLLDSIKSLEENSVVAITSKVVSIAEGRCIPVGDISDKDRLAIKEADKYIPREDSPNGLILTTIKNNLLVASSGIDESNGSDYLILWPENPYQSAKNIWQMLIEKFKVKNLGIIITDSRLVPLRRGVVGLALSFYGFKPLRDYRGKKDLFGREFKMETTNLPDGLATAAVLEMGEGNESKPLAIISDLSDIEFIQTDYQPGTPDDTFEITEKEDMFYPIFSKANWKKGG